MKILCIALWIGVAQSAELQNGEGTWFKFPSHSISEKDLDERATALIRLNDPSFRREEFALRLLVDSESSKEHFVLTYVNKVGMKSWQLTASQEGRLTKPKIKTPPEGRHYGDVHTNKVVIPQDSVDVINRFNTTSKYKIKIPTNDAIRAGPK